MFIYKFGTQDFLSLCDLTDNCMIDDRGLCCLVQAQANKGGLMRAYATTSTGMIDDRGLCCLVRAQANKGGLMWAYATMSTGLCCLMW